MKTNSWSICCSGKAPGILDTLRADVERLRSDLPDSEHAVADALMAWVERSLEVIGEAGHVRVLAFASPGPSFSLDIHVQPQGVRPAAEPPLELVG